MTLESVTALVESDLRQVEATLREGMRSIVSLVPQAGGHTLGSGGKRLRPILVLLSARLCGYQGPRAIQIAAAVELLHTATLLHDDVVDGADTRRGKPSVNALWGDRIAILVGDFLYARASATLIEDGEPDILWIFSSTISEMSEGELLQLQRSFDPEVPESVYLDIIGRKTARLMADSTESGAILAGVTRAERRALRDYGFELGLAFQLTDDALDYSDDGTVLGKSPLADLSEGKVTMPLILVLKQCSVAEHEGASSAVKELARPRGSTPDPAAVREVQGLVRRYHGAELTVERARAHAQRAKARIEPFAESEAKRALREIADVVVSRTS
jgi:octaprenyl-diphosphate synthase